MKYIEEYDDSWQELRLERLEYDEYECQDCGGKAKQVHHLRYPAKKIKECISLCENCHLKRHNIERWEENE